MNNTVGFPTWKLTAPLPESASAKSGLNVIGSAAE